MKIEVKKLLNYINNIHITGKGDNIEAVKITSSDGKWKANSTNIPAKSMFVGIVENFGNDIEELRIRDISNFLTFLKAFKKKEIEITADENAIKMSDGQLTLSYIQAIDDPNIIPSDSVSKSFDFQSGIIPNKEFVSALSNSINVIGEDNITIEISPSEEIIESEESEELPERQDGVAVFSVGDVSINSNYSTVEIPCKTNVNAYSLIVDGKTLNDILIKSLTYDKVAVELMNNGLLSIVGTKTDGAVRYFYKGKVLANG